MQLSVSRNLPLVDHQMPFNNRTVYVTYLHTQANAQLYCSTSPIGYLQSLPCVYTVSCTICLLQYYLAGLPATLDSLQNRFLVFSVLQCFIPHCINASSFTEMPSMPTHIRDQLDLTTTLQYLPPTMAFTVILQYLYLRQIEEGWKAPLV